MNIKELHITAFGRFKNKTLVLEDKLNLIYGLNEAGKSTIHRFIEAMLFGFVKPGMKRRNMLEEYDRYRPWVGDLYGGSIVYSSGGKLYRAERNLEKGRETVKVFDGITGAELTEEFNYDKSTREVLFAREHLGIGSIAYKNTISISQFGNKSDTELAREIQTRLGSSDSAGDLTLSVSKAERLIGEYLEEIGTERARMKEYGQLHERALELEARLERAAVTAKDVRALGKELRGLEIKLKDLKSGEDRLKKEIKDYEEIVLLNRWEGVQDLVKQREALGKSLCQYGEYRGFNIDDSGTLHTLEQLTEQCRQDKQKLCLKVQDIEENIEKTEVAIYKTGAEGTAYIRKKVNIGLGLCLVSTAVIAGMVYTAAALKRPFLYVLSLPVLLLFLYSAVTTIKQRKLFKMRKEDVGELIAKQRYLKKYRQDLLDALEETEKVLKEREGRSLCILKGANVATMEEYRAKAEGFKDYVRLKKELEKIKGFIEIKLEGEDMDALEDKVKGSKRDKSKGTDKPFEGLAKEADSLRLQLSTIEEEKIHLVGSIEKIKGNLEALERDVAALPGMEEEREGIRERLGQLKSEREAAKIALKVLKEASEEVHRGFAPILNNRVKEITSRITGGRYRELRITKDLGLMAIVPETGRQVNAELLSGGTLDQFYFALRIAAAELLSGGKTLPLLLDDCFTQYDRSRLENVFDYLFEEAEKRQIILLTCHNRNREIADSFNREYNYLTID